MEFLVEYLAYVILLLDISIIGYFGIKILQKFFTLPIDEYIEAFEEKVDSRYREIGLIVAFVATAGSLFLSNVLGWTPCRLCWFQRIFMYPLVVILGASLFFGDKNVSDYVVPMTVIGAGLSIYHYAVQMMTRVQSSGCSISQVSCETKYTFYFDYITIPIMALTAFVIIGILAYRNWE